MASFLDEVSPVDMPGSCDDFSIAFAFRPICDFKVEDFDLFLTVKDAIEPELTEMVVPAIRNKGARGIKMDLQLLKKK